MPPVTVWYVGNIVDGELEQVAGVYESPERVSAVSLSFAALKARDYIKQEWWGGNWAILVGDRNGPDREVAYHVEEYEHELYISDADLWVSIQTGGVDETGTGKNRLTFNKAPELFTVDEESTGNRLARVSPMRTSTVRGYPYPTALTYLDYFDDTSYGNDVADSVCFYIGDDPYIVWLSAPRIFDRTPDARETAMYRYELQHLRKKANREDTLEEKDATGDSILSTDDPNEILQWAAQEWSETHGIPITHLAELRLDGIRRREVDRVAARAAAAGAAALSPTGQLLTALSKMTYNGWTFHYSPRSANHMILARHPDSDHLVEVAVDMPEGSISVDVVEESAPGYPIAQKTLPFPKLGRTPELLLGLVRHTLDEWQPHPAEDLTAKRFGQLELDRGARKRDTGPDKDDSAERFKLIELNPSRSHRHNPPKVYRLQKVVSKIERTPAPLSPVRGGLVRSPDELVRNTLNDYLAARSTETFLILFINIRNQIIGYSEFNEGSPIQVGVTAQGIFQDALGVNAAAILTVHNHPTGDPSPSAEDYALWNRLRQAGQLIGIPVLDNMVVVAGGRYFSQSESEDK